MPKVIPKETQRQIIEFCKTGSVVQAAKEFGVCERTVKRLVHGTVRNKVKAYYVCPITGFKMELLSLQ